MAIKYYKNPKTKQTFAVLQDTKFDAVDKIAKVLGDICWMMNCDKYMMRDMYKASVKCLPEDEYSEEKGMELAKDKLLKKYYKDYDKKLDMFKDDVEQLHKRVRKMDRKKH